MPAPEPMPPGKPSDDAASMAPAFTRARRWGWRRSRAASGPRPTATPRSDRPPAGPLDGGARAPLAGGSGPRRAGAPRRPVPDIALPGQVRPGADHHLSSDAPPALSPLPELRIASQL